MTLWQEFCCIVFLSCVVPSAIIIIPLWTALVGYFIVGNVVLAFRLVAIALAPFIFLPQAFSRQALQSWMTHMIYKYFTYRIVFGEGTTPMIQEDVGRLSKATARPQIFGRSAARCLSLRFDIGHSYLARLDGALLLWVVRVRGTTRTTDATSVACHWMYQCRTTICTTRPGTLAVYHWD